MKIIHLISGSRFWGGAETYVQNLASAQVKAGHQVLIIHDCPEQKRWLQGPYQSPCLVKSEAVDLSRSISSLKNLRKIFKNFQPEVVHTHKYYANKRGCLAAWLAGIPVVVATGHGLFNTDEVGQLKKNLPSFVHDKILANFCQQIVVVSEYIAAEFKKVYPFLSKKISVIVPGLDYQALKQAALNGREIIRKQYGFEESDLIIGCFGRLQKEKGQRFFLQAAKIIETQVTKKKVIALIVGSGPDFENLQKEAFKLSLKYFKILEQTNDLPKFLQAIDLLLIPSLQEALGLIIMEAMMLKIPVVAFNTGGIAELIEDQQTGYLVARKDFKSLAEKALQIIEEYAKHQQIIKTAYDQAVECYNSELFATKMIHFYQQILNK